MSSITRSIFPDFFDLIESGTIPTIEEYLEDIATFQTRKSNLLQKMGLLAQMA
jgi:hypothetical protein